jgi:hypothetical protein
MPMKCVTQRATPARGPAERRLASGGGLDDVQRVRPTLVLV